MQYLENMRGGFVSDDNVSKESSEENYDRWGYIISFRDIMGFVYIAVTKSLVRMLLARKIVGHEHRPG